MSEREAPLERAAAEQHFSGVVRVDRGGRVELARAYGHADRAFGVANTLDTQFGLASGSKLLTALTVVSLVADGQLALTDPVRPLLGADLPEVGDDVTVEHLLAHRSGIGDYLDEDADYDVSDYVMQVPVHQLATTEDFLSSLAGHPPKFAAGERFSYCNSGYVILALLAERVTGSTFHDLVQDRVCGPAGMRDTAYLRSDELPGRAARGYLEVEGLRTNVLHLPVRGSGDGGAYATVADVHAMWQALFAGRIVPLPWVDEMLRPRSAVPEERRRYGLGCWLHEAGPAVILDGYDAGVSFLSIHNPTTGTTGTVVSNTSEGAWPLSRALDTAVA